MRYTIYLTTNLASWLAVSYDDELIDSGTYECEHYVTDERALEDIFAAFNGQGGLPHELMEAASTHYMKNQHRSLSMGDVVCLHRDLMDGVLDLYYICLPIGWRRIDRERLRLVGP